MRKLVFLFTIGLGGAAILVSLGIWQVQRLSEKSSILAEIDLRIAAEPVPLPRHADQARDAFLPVMASGTLGADYIRVLASQKQIGAGYRIIRRFETEGRAVMVDQGFVTLSEAGRLANAPAEATLSGNLHWPQETTRYIPAPDVEKNIWFARDVGALAEALKAEPVLIVQRSISEPESPVRPLPVNTAHIPNDHLQYAITWFALALIWLGMSVYYLLRPTRPPKDT